MKVTEAVADVEGVIASSGVDTGAVDAVLLEDADEKAALPGQYSGHAPGLVITITSVKIPKDLRPIVNFKATDERGDPVGKNELTEVRFLLAYLTDPGNGSTLRYVSYNTRIEDPDLTPNSGDEEVQATYDLAGLAGVKQKSNGTFRYKFATAVPANYNPAASHQVGGQFRRVFGANGVTYKANAVFAFRPDGGKVVERRQVVDTNTCNNCHTRLSEHGDIRREIQLCIMCHTPQSTDANTGNTVDMAVMIHKIHMGEELPSVQGGEPYQIVGFGNTVHDYSDVAFPQDIRNCEVCHSGTADAKAGAATYHLDHPTMAGCASCHDRTWFDTSQPTPTGYTPHLIGVPLTDDSLCATCHRPTAPGVKPIFEAHLLPTETSDAPGLKYQITGYSILNADTAPKLQITFMALNGDGTPITNLQSDANISLSGVIAWPVQEYTQRIQNTFKGSGATGTLVNNGGGSYTYTFGSSLPVGSTDTFAMALQSRRNFTHDGVTYQQGVENNARFIFTLDAKAAPVERRQSVLEANCQKCHSEVRAHGEQRVGVDFCVMCHTVLQTDETRRDPVAPTTKPETVNFKDMIHAIHRGEDLEQDFTVYGFGNIAHDFTEVRFPGDLSQCAICHKTGANGLPTPPEALPTTITENGGQPVRTVLPQTAACTSCHDGFAPVLHAALNSDLVGGAESCEVCHGTSSTFAVDLVHKQTP